MVVEFVVAGGGAGEAVGEDVEVPLDCFGSVEGGGGGRASGSEVEVEGGADW